MQQRYYDPLIGRFLSVDPVTVESATASNFSRYWYGNDNPYYFVDKDGRKGTHFCDNPAYPCGEGSFRNGEGSKQNFHTMAKVGAAAGAAVGAVAAAGCDLSSFGACVLANPALVGGGALAGAATGEAIDRAWTQLEALISKSLTSPGRTEYQYALRARQDGLYPDVRNGTVQLKAGAIWKYGTSVEPGKRYPAVALQALGLTMEVQSTGNPMQVLAQEKIQLINYVIQNGELPPGNRIYK